MTDRRSWSSHTQRIITGVIVALPLFLILAYGPYWSWYLLVAAAVGLGLWEMHGLLFNPPLSRNLLTFLIAAGVLPLSGAVLGGAAGLHAGICAALFTGLCYFLFTNPNDPDGLTFGSKFALGWLYIPYLLSFVLLIGQDEYARSWIFYLIAVVVPSDAGAYYSGRRWGRRKLYEAASPNKTIEGAFGGLAAAVLGGSTLGIAFLPDVPFYLWPFISALLAVIAMVGDLIESMIKRMSGKKDSSGLLPGHGGILDRLDSLLFVFPATWLLSVIF